MFQTTKALLDKARQFHEELRVIYARLEEISERETVKRVLDHLRRHEAELERGLASFERDLDAGILGTWFKNTPDESRWHFVKQVRFSENLEVEDVVRLAVEADQALISVYRELADLAQAEKVKEVFQQLASLAEAERDHFVDMVQDLTT